MRSAAGALVAGVVFVCACAARVSGPVAVTVQPAAEPADVDAAVRRQEDAIRTLRARFTAAFVAKGSESLSRRAAGVLLVKKPDRFRLRLLSPFGLTVLDYASWGEHARVELPLEGKRLEDDQIESMPFSPALLRRHFLRGADIPAACTAESQDAQVIVSCRAADGALRRVSIIERHTGRVTRELSRFVDGRHPQFVTEYDDYRRVGEVELPFGIRWGSESQALRVSITSYEVNPPLPDEMFEPVSAGRGP